MRCPVCRAYACEVRASGARGMLTWVKQVPQPSALNSRNIMDDVAQFFLLFEEWEVADDAAARAECCLGRTLDAYCEGTGRAPSPGEIDEVRQLRLLAADRLRAIRALAERTRRNARVL